MPRNAQSTTHTYANLNQPDTHADRFVRSRWARLPPTKFETTLNVVFPMKIKASLLLSVIILCLGLTARADTLTLKDGTVLQGQYLGGDATTVRFQTSYGLQIIEMTQVKSMSVASAGSPAAAAVPANVTIPAGTVLLVRMMDSVSSKSAVGSTFTSKLETDLVVNGVVAVKAGTLVYGKVQAATQAKRARGQSTLDIRLTTIAPNGGSIPVITSGYAQAGEHEGKKTAVAMAAGAVIGNNAGDGGRGAEGAAWGLAAASLKPGETLTVPPGAVVEFQLQQAVTVPVTR